MCIIVIISAVACFLILKQKNIVGKNFTGLNGFTAEHLLYTMKCHCHLMVDAVNKLSVIKILTLKTLKAIVLRIWLKARIWVRKSSAQMKPFHVSKDNKICFIVFFSNCY